jgi:hypothetical protein
VRCCSIWHAFCQASRPIWACPMLSPTRRARHSSWWKASAPNSLSAPLSLRNSSLRKGVVASLTQQSEACGAQRQARRRRACMGHGGWGWGEGRRKGGGKGRRKGGGEG